MMNMEFPVFVEAAPVWPAGQERQMNDLVGFRHVLVGLTAARVALRLTASTLYRVLVNGHFAGHGPVRAPHGHFRVDEWDLTARLTPGRNVVAIEVAGYNVNSYYLLNQPSFLQAEIVADAKVIAATGRQQGDGAFEAFNLDYRMRRVQRFSFQRPFMEVYRLDPKSQCWREDPDFAETGVPCARQPAVKLLPRRMSYPSFATVGATALVATGAVERRANLNPTRDRSLMNIGPLLGGYPLSELEFVASDEYQQYAYTLTTQHQRIDARTLLKVDTSTACVVDLGAALSGFPGAIIECKTAVTLGMLWDEVLTDGDVLALRNGDPVNLIHLELQPGIYHFESFEPYAMRYVKLLCTQGECTVRNVYMREYAAPDSDRVSFSCSDPRMNRIFAAAVQTFRQNAADLLTDCPGRERAGWINDSFFTSRVAHDLTGQTAIEQTFLENILLAPPLTTLPPGMIPMCYPSDHDDGVFIPQIPLWLILQLKEYLQRSGDREMIRAYEGKIGAVLHYLAGFENSDGLLEKLPSWNFLEWSAANDFMMDVNYPTNMLYAASLSAAAELWGWPDMAAKAQCIRDAIFARSFDGEFFVDNAVRAGGALANTRNRTELCQYFAYYFDIVTPTSHPELWSKLVTEFGPGRKQDNKHPEIHFANAIIGNYIRLELLHRYALREQLTEEMQGFFLKMADTTGTLWENDSSSASCNHGFASHVACWMIRDVLGVALDSVAGRVRLRQPVSGIDWIDARLPVAGGQLSVSWRREGGQWMPSASAPAGFSLQMVGAVD